jgi:hypothetical protein
MIDRRALLGATVATLLLPGIARAAAPGAITVWRDPGCGCCLAWVDRLKRDLNRPVTLIEWRDMPALKRSRGVPDELHSCHTAAIDGWTIEGHVPPEDIARLLASGDRGILGLAVPGMPMGSPGMDIGHTRREPYQVIAFGRGSARSVFARHG